MVGGTTSPKRASGKSPNINDIVEIWWSGDQVYYRGKVVSFNEKTSQHTILYDDGEYGSYVMAREPWRLFRGAPSHGLESSVDRASKQQQQRSTGSLGVTSKSHVGRQTAQQRKEPSSSALTANPGVSKQSTVAPKKKSKANLPPNPSYRPPRNPRASASNSAMPTHVDDPPSKTPMSAEFSDAGKQAEHDSRSVSSSASKHVVHQSRNLGEASTTDHPGFISTPATVDILATSVNVSKPVVDNQEAEKNVQPDSISGLDPGSTARVKPPADCVETNAETSSAAIFPVDNTSIEPASGLGKRSHNTLQGSDVAMEDPASTSQTRDDPSDTSHALKRQRTDHSIDSPTYVVDSEGSVLPLQLVMSSIVEALVVIFDERLSPIMTRLDELHAEVKRCDPYVMQQFLRKYHQDAAKALETISHELKNSRSEYRDNMRSILDDHEKVWRTAFDVAQRKMVASLAIHQEELLQSVTPALANRFACFPSRPCMEPPVLGTSQTPSQSNFANSQSTKRLTVDPSVHPHDYQARSTSKLLPPQSAALPGPGPNILQTASGAHSFVVPPMSEIHSSIEQARNPPESITTLPSNELKRMSLEIASRQVTVWLLQTEHECGNINLKDSWLKETTRQCFEAVAEKLRLHEEYDVALKELSSNLGDDNVELAWFIQYPTPVHLGLSRRNYAAWEPPPNDDEWALEEHLLRDIAERFQRALASYEPVIHDTAISVAVAVTLRAAQDVKH